MAFGPFLGGRRICLGKTFAEIVSKAVIARLLKEFDFNFKNETDRIKKHHFSMHNIHEFKLLLKLS